MATAAQEFRRPLLLKDLNTQQAGLEISPLFRPTALKAIHNVYYTDYTSAEDSRFKHANYIHDEIMDIDFIWTPGRRLSECVPENTKFNWAIASHVLEHVPDPIGWLLEVFEVLEVGAVFSLALPDKRYCYDKFRRETEVSDLVDNWIRSQKIPSPKQIYDFLSRSINDSAGESDNNFIAPDRFEDAPRTYSDKEALNFSIDSWTAGTYLDVHCSVFTPESFYGLIEKLNAIGILNVEASPPEQGKEEFFIKLKKIGTPTISHPGPPHVAALHYSSNSTQSLNKDLEHARKAFNDAVLVQNELKEIIIQLKKNRSFKTWVPDKIRKLLNLNK